MVLNWAIDTLGLFPAQINLSNCDFQLVKSSCSIFIGRVWNKNSICGNNIVLINSILFIHVKCLAVQCWILSFIICRFVVLSYNSVKSGAINTPSCFHETLTILKGQLPCKYCISKDTNVAGISSLLLELMDDPDIRPYSVLSLPGVFWGAVIITLFKK